MYLMYVYEETRKVISKFSPFKNIDNSVLGHFPKIVYNTHGLSRSVTIHNDHYSLIIVFKPENIPTRIPSGKCWLLIGQILSSNFKAPIRARTTAVELLGRKSRQSSTSVNFCR